MKFKLKREWKAREKLENYCNQMKSDNSKVFIFNDTRTYWVETWT
jgi:hypothetical protein